MFRTREEADAITCCGGVEELNVRIIELSVAVALGRLLPPQPMMAFLGEDKLLSVRLGEGKASPIGEDVGIGYFDSICIFLIAINDVK